VLEQLLGDPPARSEVLRDVGGPEPLGDLPGDMDLLVRMVGGDRRGEAGLLAFGEPFGAGAPDGPDAVERCSRRCSPGVGITPG